MAHPLITTVKSIRTAVESGAFDARDYQEFEQQYPKLYAMVAKRDCDMTMLNKLLELHLKVHVGDLEQTKADEQFGQIAVDTYVKPLVSESEA